MRYTFSSSGRSSGPLALRLLDWLQAPAAAIVLAGYIVLAGCGRPTTSQSESASRENVTGDRNSEAAPPESLALSGPKRTRSSAPRIEVTSTRYDFGEMNPHESGQRAFVVRNAGSAPLVIHSERSTCKCTVAELPEEPVAAGQEAKILLRWQTASNNRRFEESATLETNDPTQPSLTFTVSGEVLVHVGANPPELILPDVHPGQGASVTTLVTSQVWGAFRIEDFDCSLPGHRWTVAPATPVQLDKLKAKSGHQLTVHVPDSLPQGAFNHWVRFQVTPQDSVDEPKTYELPLRGKVLRRLAVYGPGIDNTGTVSLGVIDAQEGHRRRLVMKVRDPDPELRVDQIACQPSFLRIELTPYAAKNTNTKGLYYLDIEVPKSSPVGRFQSSEAGEIRIHFDHPRISDLTLRVDFAISGHRRNSPNYEQAADHFAHGFIAQRTNR